MIKEISSSESEMLLRSVIEPKTTMNLQTQNINIPNTNQVIRGWTTQRQAAMITRPLISQINNTNNNRPFINSTVIQKPILTHQINGVSRPLMNHIVSGGRHHIMSQIVASRPILSRVISGHSLMGHTITAQSLMNHVNSLTNRNIIHATNNNSNVSSQTSPRHNLTFVNYNPTLQANLQTRVNVDQRNKFTKKSNK